LSRRIKGLSFSSFWCVSMVASWSRTQSVR
jgi:hypothetical protein